MDKTCQKKWRTIDAMRRQISFAQISGSILSSSKGINLPRHYNQWFLERCKSLARWSNGSAKRLSKKAGTSKSAIERLEVLANAGSYYEPRSRSLRKQKSLLGQTEIVQGDKPKLMISARLGKRSPLRGFILAHEVTHLLVHLYIPDKVRQRSHFLGLEKEVSFKEQFNEGEDLFGADDVVFRNVEDVMRYIKERNCLQDAEKFQNRREQIFRDMSVGNFTIYFKEVAADITAAFWPLADFRELYELLPLHTQKKFEPAREERDFLLDWLDFATTASAYSKSKQELEQADSVMRAIVTVGVETKWFSPLQILLSYFTLVNFKLQGRAFELQGNDFFQTVNLAFFGAIGMDAGPGLQRLEDNK